MGLLTVLRQQSVKVGVALALIMAVTGILAPVVVPHDPNALSLPERYCPPVSCERDGRSHVLGTDHLGRDLLSRIGPSLRINLYIGILGTLLSFLGAWLLVIVRSNRSAALTTDMPGPLLGVPLYGLAILTYFIGVFISLVMVAAVGPSLMFLIILAGVFSSLLPMALVYESIRGDRASSSPVRLVVRRRITLSPIAFSLAFLMGLFFESSMSFLGIGVPPPNPSLGGIIADGRNLISTAPWIVMFPLGLVLVAVGAFSAIVIPVGRTLARSSQINPAVLLPAQVSTPAGFWRRLAASLIDYALTLVLVIIVAIITSEPASGFAGYILTIVFLTALYGISVSSPGKRSLDLYVLRPDGSEAGLVRKFCRKALSITLTYPIDCFMIAFRRDRCGLHDLICGTVVVRL